jgi:DNA primase
VFNARALSGDTIFICEGVMDALSLVAAGHTKPQVRDASAIFGLNGLRWGWVKAKQIVFAFDRDTAGDKWKELAWQGKLLGKEVYFLPPEAYGQHKDLNEAWVATGHLDIGEWNF